MIAVVFKLPPELTPEKERNGNINLSKYNSSPRPGLEPATSRFYSYTLCPSATTGLLYLS